MIKSRFHLSLFSLLFISAFFIYNPAVKTDEVEPLVGGLFVPELTVANPMLDVAEHLSVSDVTKLALIRSLNIQIAEAEGERERHEISISKAIYDTQFAMFGEYAQDLKQESSVVVGNRDLSGRYGTSLSKKLPTGTELTLEYANHRTSSNSSFTSLSRFYEASARIEVRQPLLRNFFGYLDRKRIEQTKINVQQYDYKTLDDVEGYIWEVRQLYWDLKFAYENLAAQRKALRKAQDFYEITYNKLDLGLSEKPDVFAAEANVRNRVLEVLEAESDLKSRSFAMRVFLDLTDIPLLLPVEQIDFEPIRPDFNEQLDYAFKHRRDLKQLILDIEKQDIEGKIRSRERLPELTFEGSYASTGLDRETSGAQGEVFAFNHPQYEAAFRMSTSLENRDRRGRYEQALINLKNAKILLRQTKLDVQRAVDEAYRDLLLAEERVLQTREIENLQRNKLLEEEKNFNRGRSDSKTIIDFQEDVIEAEINAIRSLVGYQKAIEDFYRTTNQLLERTGSLNL